MNPQLTSPTQRIKRLIDQHRFGVFISSVILLAVLLVMVSMWLYYSSDAFRLDLSRPEYMELRSEINKGAEKKDAFEAQGAINDEVLEDFLKRYSAESDKALNAKAFSNDVLSDEQLGLSGTAEPLSSAE